MALLTIRPAAARARSWGRCWPVRVARPRLALWPVLVAPLGAGAGLGRARIGGFRHAVSQARSLDSVVADHWRWPGMGCMGKRYLARKGGTAGIGRQHPLRKTLAAAPDSDGCVLSLDGGILSLSWSTRKSLLLCLTWNTLAGA